MLDAGLNFSLFDKRLSIDLSGSNILRDEQYRRMLHTDINIDRWDKYPSWRLKLNLRWTFSAWGKIDRSSMPQVTVPERKSTVPFAN